MMSTLCLGEMNYLTAIETIQTSQYELDQQYSIMRFHGV